MSNKFVKALEEDFSGFSDALVGAYLDNHLMQDESEMTISVVREHLLAGCEECLAGFLARKNRLQEISLRGKRKLGDIKKEEEVD